MDAPPETSADDVYIFSTPKGERYLVNGHSSCSLGFDIGIGETEGRLPYHQTESF